MRNLKATNAFKKDMRIVSQYKSFDPEFFDKCLNNLKNNESLPNRCKDHKLSKTSPKKYQGFRDFHIAPDICVLYEIRSNDVILQRIGKHNNLQLTEDM